jgi:hypothetical protein
MFKPLVESNREIFTRPIFGTKYRKYLVNISFGYLLLCDNLIIHFCNVVHAVLPVDFRVQISLLLTVVRIGIAFLLRDNRRHIGRFGILNKTEL